MRHLTETDAVAALLNGRAIEQLLADVNENGAKIVRFAHLNKERGGEFSVTLFEVLDEGNADFFDVYEFSALDPDYPYGKTFSFTDPSDALAYVTTKFGGLPGNFVNAGVVQDEYRDRYFPVRNG